MKVNITKGLEENGILPHLVLHGLTLSLSGEGVAKLAHEGATKEGVILDVRVIVNDIEINIEDFVNHWESQVDKLIAEKAECLISDKIAKLYNAVDELESKMLEELRERKIKGRKP